MNINDILKRIIIVFEDDKEVYKNNILTSEERQNDTDNKYIFEKETQ